jgi:hypothetical protein
MCFSRLLCVRGAYGAWDPLSLRTPLATEAYASLKLRFNEIERQVTRGTGFLMEFADLLETIRGPQRLAREFNLWDHPLLQDLRRRQAERHSNIDTYAWDKALVKIIYRADADSQFASHRPAREARERATRDEKAEATLAMKQASALPARLPVSFETVKARLFRQQWQKELHNAASAVDKVFSLPRQALTEPMLSAAADVMARPFIPPPAAVAETAQVGAGEVAGYGDLGLEDDGLQDDPGLEDEGEPASDWPGASPQPEVAQAAEDQLAVQQVFFKVIRARPALLHLQKVAPGLGATLKQDSMLVSVVRPLFEKGGNVVASLAPVRVRHGSGSTTCVLSLLDTPISLQVKAWKPAAAAPGTRLQYGFRGASGSLEDAPLVTSMVEASAVHGTENFYEVGWADASNGRLQALKGEGLVAELLSPHPSSRRWQLTQMGKASLDYGIELEDAGLVSAPPATLLALPLDGLSKYHLALRLEAEGWTCYCGPQGNLPPHTPDGEKNWLSRGNEPNRSYMLALLSSKNLFSCGVEEIAHGRSKTYYDELLSVLSTRSQEDLLRVGLDDDSEGCGMAAILDGNADSPGHDDLESMEPALFDDGASLSHCSAGSGADSPGSPGGAATPVPSELLQLQQEAVSPITAAALQASLEEPGAQAPAVEDHPGMVDAGDSGLAGGRACENERADGDGTGGPRRKVNKAAYVERWGIFRLSMKKASAQSRFGGLQAECPLHRKNGKTRCKKLWPLAGNDEASFKEARRCLMFWCLRGLVLNRQRDHISIKFEASTVPADVALEAVHEEPARPVRTDVELDAEERQERQSAEQAELADGSAASAAARTKPTRPAAKKRKGIAVAAKASGAVAAVSKRRRGPAIASAAVAARPPQASGSAAPSQPSLARGAVEGAALVRAASAAASGSKSGVASPSCSKSSPSSPTDSESDSARSSATSEGRAGCEEDDEMTLADFARASGNYSVAAVPEVPSNSSSSSSSSSDSGSPSE